MAGIGDSGSSAALKCEKAKPTQGMEVRRISNRGLRPRDNTPPQVPEPAPAASAALPRCVNGLPEAAITSARCHIPPTSHARKSNQETTSRQLRDDWRGKVPARARVQVTLTLVE
jgi:hypothetical protein